MLLFPTFECMSTANIMDWANVHEVNDFKYLKELLEITDDEVVFIIAARQHKYFEEILTSYDLKKFITYDQGKFIHNPNYMETGPRIKMYVLKGQGEHYEY